MKKKSSQKKSRNESGTWVLVNKQRKTIFESENIAEVVEEGQKYKLGEVYIEKKFPPGARFAFPCVQTPAEFI